PLYLEAKAICEKVLGKEHPNYATSLNNLATLYQSMGDTARAEPLYLEAKAICEKVLGKEHPNYATSLNNLATLYQSMGDTARAEPLCLEAKAICEKVLGKEHPNYAASLNNLAGLYAASDRADMAIPLHEDSLAIQRKRIHEAATILSERQQLAMNQSLRFHLDNYIDTCTRSSLAPKNAVSNVMLWKGSTLYRQRQMRKAADSPAIADQFAKLQLAVRQLSQLAQAPPGPDKYDNWKQRLAELTAEKETLESGLSRKSAAFRDAMQEITFEQIQQAIPADTVLVDYLEYNGRKGRSLLASIVRPNAAPVMIDLGSANEASQAIDSWRESFGMSPQGKAAGLQLRKQIWEPLLLHIDDAQTVLVATDGVLGRLPLAALPGKAPGTYLLEDHRLALIPVPQLLPALVNELGKEQLRKDLSTAENVAHELLLIGDVDYDAVPGYADQPARDDPAPRKRPWERSQTLASQVRGGVTWGPLEQTRAEVEYIGGLYKRIFSPPAEAVIDLRKTAATETAFRNLAPTCVYLHLATHGFFAAPDVKSALSSDLVAQRGMERAGMLGQNRDAVVGLSPGQLSGLVFAGANRRLDATQIAADVDDGILTSDEIAFLPLENVQLAVLSACETGLGEGAGGEGLLGIQRSFQIAGTRSTVASLWNVSDGATRRIMQEFYTNYLEKEMSMLDSLREAQLWALTHPADIPRGPIVSRPGAAVIDAPEAQTEDRLSPQYWAPFVLSGDWR
ncbi:MAG: CHAT domain-containing protein, partial [Pirellulaceae bacterium]|nr:CHAT domain-containing protein [Pirellulaceae bacterium]